MGTTGWGAAIGAASGGAGGTSIVVDWWWMGEKSGAPGRVTGALRLCGAKSPLGLELDHGKSHVMKILIIYDLCEERIQDKNDNP